MALKDRIKFNMLRNRNNKRIGKENMFVLLKITGIFLSILIVSIAVVISFVFRYNGYVKDKASKVEVVNKETVVKDSSKLEKEVIENKLLPVVKPVDETFNITVLGDIMMGKTNFDSSKDSYMLAFKNIVEYTKKADYTICNLTTNISNLNKIEYPISKYIVTKDILNAFNALGVDGVNLASDHMLDFGIRQFKTTTTILKEDELDIIGLSKDIVYAEKGGIRVAFIGMNTVAIGSIYNYTLAGINMYDWTRTKALIKEAKKNSDAVIVMPHYGKENTYVVSDYMREISRTVINLGADMVIGSHSLGIYPIEEYKGKQIIYSSGYFMSDTYYEIGKQSAIFNILVNKKGEITKTEVIPVYVDGDKGVKLYSDVNKKDSEDYLNRIFSNNTFIKYSAKNSNGKIVVTKK